MMQQLPSADSLLHRKELNEVEFGQVSFFPLQHQHQYGGGGGGGGDPLLILIQAFSVV